jgi:Tol biopolymer transport system component
VNVTAADDWCTIPQISDNGQYVAFSSLSGTLTGQAADGDDNDVIFRDRANHTTTCLSVTPGNVANTGDSELAAMSASGRYVAFTSTSTQLVGGTVYPGLNPMGAYLADTQNHTLIRIDLTPQGGQSDDGVGYGMSFSADGAYLTFSSTADNLVAGGTAVGVENVYLYQLSTRTITLVSQTGAGVQADGGCYAPKISGDGRYVAFLSDATNLDPLDTNGHTDIYIADTQAVPTRMTRVSLGATGVQADNDAIYQIGFSRDGAFISWYTGADNLLSPIPADSNGSLDVFELGTWLESQPEDDGMDNSNG